MYQIQQGNHYGFLEYNVVNAGMNGQAGMDTFMLTDAPEYLQDAIDLLLYMIEEEKVAGDLYEQFYEQTGLQVFENVAASEDRHMDALVNQALLAGIDVSGVISLPAGVYSNTDLQALYDNLLETGSVSVNAAIGVGQLVEQTDITDLQAAIITVAGTPLENTYSHLLTGSEHHLAAFNLFNPTLPSAPEYAQSRDFLFDPVYYLLSNPELASTVTLQNAFDHYLSTGAALGYEPNSWFDPSYYENRWDDLKAANLDDATLFLHYNLYGVWEGRSASPAFDQYDGNRYLSDYPDVAAYVDANIDEFLGSRTNGAIAHFIIYGEAEGRLAYDLAGIPIDMDILI